jgi:hypothetical protein
MKKVVKLGIYMVSVAGPLSSSAEWCLVQIHPNEPALGVELVELLAAGLSHRRRVCISCYLPTYAADGRRAR